MRWLARKIGGFILVAILRHFLDRWEDRLLRPWKPKPVKAPTPSPLPAQKPVEAPHVPKRREFAPIPIAGEVEHETAPMAPSMPDRMRAFIEKGDRAIHS